MYVLHSIKYIPELEGSVTKPWRKKYPKHKVEGIMIQ